MFHCYVSLSGGTRKLLVFGKILMVPIESRGPAIFRQHLASRWVEYSDFTNGFVGAGMRWCPYNFSSFDVLWQTSQGENQIVLSPVDVFVVLPSCT